ncbi:hypothetical protein W97_04980 [Coniosporium apollinis CBS 100218]|uniref:Major facilitator superfamily (MFS) profile domain-containing protein n=1 Tax=Coniosporium apollinis (strain CBS 100218) TaxID=1168221 RepID=R7YVQ6_CONA1|nr:uncharacterized protein W97_04980 [Coniosporium apollinis CBS 100218]EON65741.1 hypothetical protein W97_04980 [Coniosporium apollinis CBS 100218]
MAASNTPENVRQKIEQELHSELLPGTELMTEVAGVHLVHAHNAPNAVALVPQPSFDPSDPLNWSKLWKTIVLANQGLFVLLSIITTLSIAPLTPIYMAEWNKNQTEVALLTGAAVVALGYANFIIIPCADVFGRRPVLLICCAITLISDIWQAAAKSYNSFLAARIVSGLGTAANESIMTIVVTDIIFLHERGRFVGIYFWCYFVGIMLGPIIAGNVAAHVSWRWFFWACTISQAVNFASLIFFFPETRRTKALSAPPTTLVDTPPIKGDDEKTIRKTDLHAEYQEETGAEVDIIPVNQHLGRGRPSRTQLNFFQSIDRSAVSTILHHIVTPIEIFFYPIIFWVSMAVGAAANSLLCVNLIQSQALAAPPYNFSPANVGFANFALAVGAIIGLAAAGPFSDWIAMRATRRNGGIREPEMRLPALIPFIVAAAVGMTVVGVGFQHQWPWEPVIIVGFALVGVLSVSIPTITITYAIDCYKPIAGQIMVTATVTKNTFGFGMTYFVNDWAAEHGFVPPLMLLMAMTVGFSLIGMLVSLAYGKTMRRWTRNAKLHQF